MKALIFAAIFVGLFLLFFFSPTIMYPNFEDCSGQGRLTGEFIKIFYSKNENKIGLFRAENKTFLAFLQNFEVLKMKNYTVYAKLSKFENQCWLFPDEVTEAD